MFVRGAHLNSFPPDGSKLILDVLKYALEFVKVAVGFAVELWGWND